MTKFKLSPQQPIDMEQIERFVDRFAGCLLPLGIKIFSLLRESTIHTFCKLINQFGVVLATDSKALLETVSKPQALLFPIFLEISTSASSFAMHFVIYNILSFLQSGWQVSKMPKANLALQQRLCIFNCIWNCLVLAMSIVFTECSIFYHSIFNTLTWYRLFD